MAADSQAKWLSPALFKLCNHTHKKGKPFLISRGKISLMQVETMISFLFAVLWCFARAGYLRTRLDLQQTNGVRSTSLALSGHKNIAAWQCVFIHYPKYITVKIM